MVEMPTHEEKRFDSVLFLQVRRKAHRKVPFKWHHCNGSFVLEPCDPVGSHTWQSRVGGQHEARCNGVSRSGTGEVNARGHSCVAKRPKSEELPLLAGAKPLIAVDTTLYRVSHGACELLVSLDRPDVLFAAGPLARGMKSPTTNKELKRVGRYLRRRPVAGIVFEPPTLLGVWEVFCDADHAGHLGTRTSRSGMAVMLGSHSIKHGSPVQSTVALSSGESQYYALLRSILFLLSTKCALPIRARARELQRDPSGYSA